jgi:ankyrin repeat protein
MERIKGQKPGFRQLAETVLTWIVCATRPLKTSELQHALAVEVGERELDEDNIPQVEDMVSVCAGLVTVDRESNVVRLVHYTTQEYFDQTQNHWFPAAEEDITTTCVTYLSFSTFGTGFCGSHEDFEQRLQSYPFYNYAAHSWAHHARNCRTLNQCVINFLENGSNVEAASQALFATKLYQRGGRSRRVPQETTGVHLAAYFQLDEAIEALLLKGHSLGPRDSLGQTPLSYAADGGYENGVRIMLNCDQIDSDSRDNEGVTPLMCAARNGHDTIVNFLLNDERVNINSKDVGGRTPLLWAAQNKHWITVLHLLEKGADAHSREEFGQTLLSFAAERGRDDFVELLLSMDGVDADTKDICNLTPLLLATAFERREVVMQLLPKLAMELTTSNVSFPSQKRIIREARQLNHDLPSHILPVQVVDSDIVSHAILYKFQSGYSSTQYHWQGAILGPVCMPNYLSSEIAQTKFVEPSGMDSL